MTTCCLGHRVCPHPERQGVFPETPSWPEADSSELLSAVKGRLVAESQGRRDVTQRGPCEGAEPALLLEADALGGSSAALRPSGKSRARVRCCPWTEVRENHMPHPEHMVHLSPGAGGINIRGWL